MYAELAVKVALNVQPGQRVLIIGPLANGGASLEAAPLARQIAAAAYRAGSPLVETIYGDEAAADRSASSTRRANRSAVFRRGCRRRCPSMSRAGHAVLSISANDPDLLQGEPPELVSARAAGDRARDAAVSRAGVAQRHELGGRCRRERRLGRKDLSRHSRRARRFRELWDAIARMCRLDAPDPLAAWETHLGNLAARSEYLNSQAVFRVEVHRPRHRSHARPS